MYGMPLPQAFIFVIAVILIVVTIQRRYLHPFVAIWLSRRRSAYVAGSTTSVLTQDFGSGFAAMMLFARLGDRCRRLDFRSGRNHDGVRSIDAKHSSSGEGAGRGFRPAGSQPASASSPASAHPRLPLLCCSRRYCGRWREHRRNSTKPHGHTGAGDFGSHGVVWLTPVRSRPRPFSAPNGSTSRCSACHWRFSSPHSAQSLPGGSR